MISSEYDSNDDALHQFVTYTYVPLNGQTLHFLIKKSNRNDSHVGGGYVTINGNDVFNTGNVIYNFAGTEVPHLILIPPHQ